MRRRFIAGAVCPQCQARDRIVIEIENTDESIERQRCVECGYASARPGGGGIHTGVPRGKPEQSDTGPQSATQPIRILDPDEVPQPRKPRIRS